jgi:hypothetical protein
MGEGALAITEQSRIAFLQFGDFREADQRVRDGLGETYHAQRFSMGVVERLAERTALTAVISVESNAPHDEILHSGVRSIGLQNIWACSATFKVRTARRSG